MRNRRLILIMLLGAALLVLAAAAWKVQPGVIPASSKTNRPPQATAHIRGRTFSLDVATTPSAREIGLSQTDSLPEDRGMLFLYDTPDYYTFWMKGMKFPLDILFIRDSTIVTIARNVPPPSGTGDLPLYAPNEPANKVLEINAGLCDKYGIREGDTVEITFSEANLLHPRDTAIAG
jgi:uncharacterized membrane protein (UPF0127 family)